jgi:hypothetical protein
MCLRFTTVDLDPMDDPSEIKRARVDLAFRDPPVAPLNPGLPDGATWFRCAVCMKMQGRLMYRIPLYKIFGAEMFTRTTGFYTCFKCSHSPDVFTLLEQGAKFATISKRTE